MTNGQHPVRDIYACGLDHVELLGGGIARLVLYGERDGERFILADAVLLPIAAIPDAVKKALAATGSEAVYAIKRLLPLYLH